MTILYVIFVMFTTSIVTLAENVKTPKIGIVGAGIGGASTFHYLKTHFPESTIHVFESNIIGGRLNTVEILSRKYEIGGSIIHPKNKYMVDFAKKLGLKHRQTKSMSLGIFNGTDYVFKESSWSIVNYYNLITKYGITTLIKSLKLVADTLKKFDNIYNLQDKKLTYTSASNLMESMDKSFPNLAMIKLKGYLETMKISENYIDELVQAITLVNYGQDANIKAFVGLVSMAGSGSDLWAVEGGNDEVPRNLLSPQKQLIFANEHISKIKLLSNGQFEFITSDNKTEIFDIAIIATPQNSKKNQIIFEDFPKKIEFKGKFHRTVSTIVQGKFNYSAVNLTEEEDIKMILSCTPDSKYTSIGKINPVDYKKNEKLPEVWKIFSPDILSKEDLNTLFTEVNHIKQMDWLAYPQYNSLNSLPSFVLHSNLYHVNAIEWAASAMEMSSIGGRNVANLAYNFWTNDQSKIDKLSFSKRKEL